jgi:hypothetical protein
MTQHKAKIIDLRDEIDQDFIGGVECSCGWWDQSVRSREEAKLKIQGHLTGSEK